MLGEAPPGDEPVGDPDDAPTVDLPSSAEPPVIEWDDLPEPTQPAPTPEPVQTLPPLPTLPPLAPVPEVVAPGTAPSVPSTPSGPAAPTLEGPAAGTVLTTFPTVTGTADPGATVVVTTTSGDPLTTAVADATGAWSGRVCGDLAAAPPACLAGTGTLSVTAHTRDDASGHESGVSAALSWSFDRPVLSDPTDGAVIEVPAQGDVSLRVDGTVGELVQLSVDGTPTGELHAVGSAGDVVWRSPAAGSHTLSLRYVEVAEGGGATVTGYGPSSTWTVTVAGPEATPEGTQQTTPGATMPEAPGAASDAAPDDPSRATGDRPADTPESTPKTTS